MVSTKNNLNIHQVLTKVQVVSSRFQKHMSEEK